MYKAMVVDDHPFIRTSVKGMLLEKNIEVVAEAANGPDAVKLAQEHAPDLILLDIGIPKLDGLEVIARIRALGLTSKILVLTAQPAQFYSMRCMKAGATGYMSKTDELHELHKAIDAILSGYTFFPDLASNSVNRNDVEASEQALIKTLSDRELTILQQLARGFTNQEIGNAMLLSNKTISTYKARLIEKLNVKSLVYLADFAKRNNLI